MGSKDAEGDLANSQGPPEATVALIANLLGFVRRHLGVDTAWLSAFRDGMQVFEVLDGDDAVGLSCGDGSALAGSYCLRVVDGRLPTVVSDTAANQTTAELTVTGDLSLGAYVGMPIYDSAGTPVGSLCAVSRSPKPHLDDVDLHIVEKVARFIESLLSPKTPHPEGNAGQRAAIRRIVAEQDFEVVFQAVHELHSGAVVGVEALTRFTCEPYRPDLFFQQAAELGLDIELQLAVVKRVIALLPHLPDHIFVAINISPAAALLAPWSELLAPVDPTRLVLEITEHDAVHDYTALGVALDVPRRRGVRVAIDDVGAGFASFAHVFELSPDIVKIDQSIVRNIDTDGNRRLLVRAIAELAQQTNAHVIAEAVETQDELNTLGNVGITWCQGFYLSRPRPYEHGFPCTAHRAEPRDPLLAKPFRAYATTGTDQ